MRILVAGAGGFIGGYIVGELLTRFADEVTIDAVDVKPLEEWHQVHNVINLDKFDLREYHTCRAVMAGATHVINLAADMGGMGFIETHKADCMQSVLINTNLLRAAVSMPRSGGEVPDRFFFASSACVYAGAKQTDPNVTALREEDAYPADPEDGYGWEKLFSERMCRHFREDYGLETRVARYHNVYGPEGTWTGGREKAPAALCRKVAEAVLTGVHQIQVWGNGEQTRSFMYVDDCVEGTLRLIESDVHEPINVGSSELVSINQLIDIIQDIAGVKVERVYDLSAPQGVMGRNSDNTLIREVLDWEPSITLREGLEKTYKWVYEQVEARMLNDA